MSLVEAATTDDISHVRELLRSGADVNQADAFGGTPLYHAARNGHADIVRAILALPGIDIEKTGDGYTPLMAASLFGHTDVVRMLLAAGANVNYTSPEGYTALTVADNRAVKSILREAMNAVPVAVIAEDLPEMLVPANQDDAISAEAIENGTVMADFHGERDFGRYYTKSTYDSLPAPKKNPQSRKVIAPKEVVFYRAKVQMDGGVLASTMSQRKTALGISMLKSLRREVRQAQHAFVLRSQAENRPITQEDVNEAGRKAEAKWFRNNRTGVTRTGGRHRRLTRRTRKNRK